MSPHKNSKDVAKDSLRHSNALGVAISVREQYPHQVIVFSSDRANPVLVREGMVAALWSRAYWLNQPTKHHAYVLPEIPWAFHGKKPLNSRVLEHAASQTSHAGSLTPQPHRVMRLVSLGASNAKIARDCKMTPKAVERTIATASTAQITGFFGSLGLTGPVQSGRATVGFSSGLKPPIDQSNNWHCNYADNLIYQGTPNISDEYSVWKARHNDFQH